MWFDEDSDEDEKPVIERNANNEKKDKCGCTTGCSKDTCSCFKFGSGCNSSCGCESSCQNMFNHLEYFFGENNKCAANPCFTLCLMKNAKDADELKTIDREKLCRRIMRCANFSTVFDDEDFQEWKKEWKATDKDNKLALTQELFRMLLSDSSSTYYYSFCRNDIVEEDCGWHCITCKKCMDWREWHCDKCDKCTYGANFPCMRCERGSETFSFF